MRWSAAAIRYLYTFPLLQALEGKRVKYPREDRADLKFSHGERESAEEKACLVARGFSREWGGPANRYGKEIFGLDRKMNHLERPEDSSNQSI
jgi:hypothetical protein